MTFYANRNIRRELAEFAGDRLGEYPEYWGAVLRIRKACARANAGQGYLTADKADAIQKAADKLLSQAGTGDFLPETVLRFIGKPANRRLDELIEAAAEGAAALTAKDVSLNQQTLDVTLTAEAMAVRAALQSLQESANVLAEGLDAKAGEFRDVVKCGRLGLKDALPVRLGDEFGAHRDTLRAVVRELREEEQYWRFSLLGAGDLGTGIGVLPGFGAAAAAELSAEVGVGLEDKTPDALAAMNNRFRFVIAHAKIEALALQLWKLARDFVILASGPRAGIREIVLPAVAPGSSIMPGKINPTVAECIMALCDKVFSNSAGLNVGVHSGWLGAGSTSSLPLKCLLNSAQLLSRGCLVLQEKVVAGITANADRCRMQADGSLAFAVLLRSAVGEETARRAERRAVRDGITVREAYAAEEGPIAAGSLLDDLFNAAEISTAAGAARFMRRLAEEKGA
jgi:aspartate ammonia-lyase